MKFLALLTSACIFISSSALAQKVFSIGTGAMPNTNFINPLNDADLNPASVLPKPLSLSDKGAWTAGFSYSQGDYITFNGLRYVALSSFSSASSIGADMATGNWVLYKTASSTSYEGTRFLGMTSYGSASAWTTGTSYSLGTSTIVNGISYVAAQSHVSTASFSSDVSNGYWVLSSTAPTLSLYVLPSPVGGICLDFDETFKTGSGSYEISFPLNRANLNNSGVNLTGSYKFSVAFDWENETIKPSGDITLTSYPSMSPGGSKFNLKADPMGWTKWSFHTGGKCGQFKIAHSGNYPVTNLTCFTGTTFSMQATVRFYQKGQKFIATATVHPVGEAYKKNQIEFYNSIFNVGDACSASTRSHYADATGGYMKGK